MNGPPELPKRRTNRTALAWVLAILLTPLLVVLAIYLSFRIRNGSAIHQLESKARQKGEPLSLTELALRYPTIPDDQNVAVALLAIWEKENPAFWQAYRQGVRPMPERVSERVAPALPFLGSEAKRLSRTQPMPPANREALTNYLAQHAAHMDAVRQALERPRCSFPTKITEGFAALMPYLPEMRREGQNFRLAAADALERGDVDAALAAFDEIRRTGQALTECPTLIDQLVRVACLSMVLEDSQRLLSRQSLSANQLARLERVIQGLDTPGALRTALLSERASSLSVFNLPPEAMAQMGDGSSDDSPFGSARGYRLGIGLLRATGLAAADRRLMLETMEQALALADEDSPAALKKYEALFASVSEKAREFPPKIFSGLLLPSLSRAGDRFAVLEARQRAGLVSIAIERYRLAHQGKLPDKLEALVPDFLPQIPQDPFDGEPLRFHALSPGYVVYSVGPDRKDDGGKERPEKGVAKDFDETFMVER